MNNTPLKTFIIALIIAHIILLVLQVGQIINRCSNASQNSSGAKIETILEIRHDTLIRIDSVLKYKIRRIEAMPDTEIVNVFDTVFADTGHSDTVKTTVYAERECLKCKDSLSACKQIVHVDSSVIDTLVKIVPDTIKITPSILDRVKDFGAGLLVGAGIRSFF